MSNLPSISGKKAVKTFKKLGFTEKRTHGSHILLEKEGHPYILSVPVHGNSDLKTGTLRGLIKASGHTLEEFFDIL